MRQVLLAASFVATAQLAVAQCTAFANTPPGSNLSMREEGVHRVALGFAFRFANVLYDRITVCDNGYVWLGDGPATAAADFSATAAEFQSQPPRLAVCWDDLHSDSVLVPPGGGVFFRTDGAVATVVWKGIPHFFHQSVFANMELVLTSDSHPTNPNEIAFVYDATMMPMTGINLVGISAGNGAPFPPATQPPNVSFAAFAGTAVGATTYEVFSPASGASPFNLAGQTLRFVPVDPATAMDHTLVRTPLPACAPLPAYPPAATTPTAFGVGCPTPIPAGSIYESFTASTGTSPIDLAHVDILFVRNGGSYLTIPGVPFDPTYTVAGVAQPGGDDLLVANLAVGAMGTFPFGTRTTTSINLCTNGFLWLDGSTGTSFTPTAAAFHAEGARIAPFWSDLDTSAVGGGTIFYENNNPTFSRFTFANVREFGQAASANTFQVTLFASGDIGLSYGAMTGGIAHASLVGISGGGVTLDPGAVDLATGGFANSLVRDISPRGTMVHALDTPCHLGLGLTLRSTVPAPLSGAGVFVVGGSSPGLPLDGQGAPGCSLYASLDNLFFVAVPASPMVTTLAVPAVPALAGAPLFSQAAAFSVLNAFGIIASNGVAFSVGI